MSEAALVVRRDCASAVAALAVGVAFHGCQCHDVCPEPYDPTAFCHSTGPCTVPAPPTTQCTAAGTIPNCVLWNPTLDVLTLPVGEMWPTLGTRDDLAIDCSCPGAPQAEAGDAGSACNSDVTVLFDGQPATGCSCPPGRPMMCSNIPRSVKVITLNFAEVEPDVVLEFQDSECQATHRICER